MTQNEPSINRLALAISSCDQVCTANENSSHPCNSVVKWQVDEWGGDIDRIEGSSMHRPEAWTGNLTSAPIIFLASNPSFSSTENFPTWDSSKWTDDEITDFGVNRFTTEISRKYGATQSNSLEKQDRTIGLDGSLSDKVEYWVWVRRYAALILGKELQDVSAIEDYVMTELVHCKSPSEQGVMQALQTCSEKWFEKIMMESSSKLVFVAGAKAGEAFARIYHHQLPETWGCWSNSEVGRGKGFWPKSKDALETAIENKQWNLEHQLKNTTEIMIGGKKRLAIYIARPNRGASIYAPWVHPNLISSKLINYWQEYLAG